MKYEASRNERKRNETREELKRIQERISFSIDQYEYSSKKALELLENSSSDNGETRIGFIEDPAQLYEILSDARQRTQYKQKFTVFIIGYEEKCESREKLLRQVEDFFMETKASNITRLVDEISSDHDEFDFDDALATMSNALETTSGALAKLQKLQQDISQVFSVYAAFPNDKKGRKKLEKALLKAQEDCDNLSSSLGNVQGELEQSKEKAKKLQKQLDTKNSEIGKLQKLLEGAKLLKENNQSLQKELKEANELLLKSQQEKQKLQQTTELSSASISVSPEYLKLKAELERQKELNQQLTSEYQTKETALINEIESVKENYEAEITELRDKFEEQMKSLMDLDDMEFEDKHSSNGEDNIDYLDEAEPEIILDSDINYDQAPVEQSMDDIASPEETSPQEAAPEEEAVQIQATPHIVVEDVTSREEAEANQRQLEDELKEVKSKSKKMIASLKAQIMDQQNKHEAAISDHKKEVSKLESQYDAMKKGREQERSEHKAINTEKERIEHELSQSLSTRDEQAHTIENLQAQLDVLQEQVDVHLVKQVDDGLVTVSCSVQWETPVHTNSNMSMLTQVITPLSMHEVLLEDGKSFGKTSQQSASSHIVSEDEEEKRETFDSELSSASMSPNVSPTPNTQRQSCGSEQPITVITMDHPIFKECKKVYASVIQFKKKMISLLSSIGSPESAALTELNLLKEIKDGDHTANVQTQVTLMRHNLIATVNKIDQLLNIEMKRLAIPEIVVKTEDHKISQAHEDELIRVRVELRNTKRTMEVESEEYHKMLRDLKDANENLKAEVAYLKKIATKNRQATSELIMFTRLDGDRNSLSLKSALQSNKISDDVYSQTVKAMEDYGSISSQQLINLAQQCKHNMVISRIMHQLEGLNPAKREAIQERIVQYSLKKTRCLSAKLDELRTQKNQLANVLTSTLSEIENETGVFLIKPIIRGKNRDLPVPTFRTPGKPNAPVRYSVDKRWPVTKPKHHHDRNTKSHTLCQPQLQQIGSANRDLLPDVSSRHTKFQSTELYQQRKVITEVKPETIVVYGSEPPSRRRASQPTDTERKWNIDESVPPTGNTKNYYDDGSAISKGVLPPINVPSDRVTA